MKAKDLSSVYRVFDPEKPLKGRELKEFYVERESPIMKIKNEILNSPEKPLKILFTGARGNGKTTELNRLVEDEEFKKKIEAVFFSVKDELDVVDVKHPDIILLIGAKIYEIYKYCENNKVKLRKSNKVKLLKSIKEEMDNFSKRVVERVVEKIKSAELGTGFSAILKLVSKFKNESVTREISRQVVEPRLSELISLINKMIFLVEEELKKKIVVIIDDLDKLEAETAENLFFNHALTLTAPQCHIIYTFPVSISFSKKISQIKRYFDDDRRLPNICLRDKKGKEIKGNYRLLRKMVKRRMEEDLITKAALNLAIEKCGGVIHDFIRLIRLTASDVDEEGRKKIEKRDVEALFLRMVNDYERIVDEEDIEVLRKVKEKKEKTDGDIFRRLLFALAVLEYVDSDGRLWYDLHPAVEEIVK